MSDDVPNESPKPRRNKHRSKMTIRLPSALNTLLAVKADELGITVNELIRRRLMEASIPRLANRQAVTKADMAEAITASTSGTPDKLNATQEHFRLMRLVKMLGDWFEATQEATFLLPDNEIQLEGESSLVKLASAIHLFQLTDRP